LAKLSALPDIIAAVMSLLATFYVARFVVSLVEKLLVAAGVDGLRSPQSRVCKLHKQITPPGAT
jgi:hypothetical protein